MSNEKLPIFIDLMKLKVNFFLVNPQKNHKNANLHLYHVSYSRNISV